MRTKRITPLLFFLPFLALLGVLGSCLTPVPDVAPSAALHRAPRAGPVEAPRDWANLEEMHAYHVERFVESEGFGVSRIFRPEELRPITVNGTTYRITDLELISLMTTKHDHPVAYVGHPGWVRSGETVPTRPLNPIESDAVPLPPHVTLPRPSSVYPPRGHSTMVRSCEPRHLYPQASSNKAGAFERQPF